MPLKTCCMSTPERVAWKRFFQSLDVEAAAEDRGDGADRSHDDVLPNDHRCNLIHCTCRSSRLRKQFYFHPRSPVYTAVGLLKPLLLPLYLWQSQYQAWPLLLSQLECQNSCCYYSRNYKASFVTTVAMRKILWLAQSQIQSLCHYHSFNAKASVVITFKYRASCD